ncbi:DUF885 domain-containing protein [Amycolatopsis nigrescens]|uniref:DUF885 domain-containing protein n=1 Tax=Amycolatopsis nigrescens TaxID=381445 RepID=UPI00037AE234|nr:DUF885 domain-containing protein [Amycolatopsis nigrescens]
MTGSSAIGALADEVVTELFDAEPLWPALLGIDSPGSATDGLGALDERSEQEHRARLAVLAERARALDPATLPAADRVTRDVLLAQVRAVLDRIDSHAVEFTITDFFVAPAVGLLTQLPMIEPAGEERRRFPGRLAAIPAYLEQALQRHRAGAEAGRLPVAHLVRSAVAHLDRYLADPASDPLARRPAPDERFAEQRAKLLAEVVRPGFAAYRDGLAELAPLGRPPERAGVCWLPEGERIYAALARTHTTTEHTPDELHDTGLRLIDELAGEYAEIGARVFGTGEPTEIFARLRTDPALRWRDADELLATARSAIGRAELAAPGWFGRIPPQPWAVEAVPAAEAPGAAPAYYLRGTADGSRPGTYFANTHQVTERFRHAAEATAFHEAIPGHHFQLSIAVGLDELPLLRRIGGFNAYTEGWGLYSERLAFEMGLYSDDVSLLGMLSMDSMRAGRLVVDTGLHAKGWSRLQAVDYLREHTPMPLVEIESEVDRYLAYPGQALSYMVGRLEIQRLRRRSEQELEGRFDIREFHDLVLGGGALPLSVLDTVAADWVEERR